MQEYYAQVLGKLGAPALAPGAPEVQWELPRAEGMQTAALRPPPDAIDWQALKKVTPVQDEGTVSTACAVILF